MQKGNYQMSIKNKIHFNQHYGGIYYAACGIRKFYTGITAWRKKVTCNNCKRTKRFKND